MVLDVLGSIRVAEGAQGLIVVVLGGAQVGEHQRLRVAAERVLESIL
jgi:hypothetical protein